MPSKYSLKEYIEGGYYHVYNRGVNKEEIYKDAQDYVVFLRFLKEYLLPPDHPDLKKLQKLQIRRKPINCHEHIELLAFCLMPNHFHLFIKQKTETGLIPFMKALATNYSMYFNHKYRRIGPMFQGRYKAVQITSDQYFLHLSRYIHLNPLPLLARDSPLHIYPYSSYPYYLGTYQADWLHPEEVLAQFRSAKSSYSSDILSYESFVEEYKYNEVEILKTLTIDYDD